MIERHKITGLARFSALSFSQQFQTPGLRVFRTFQGESTTGMVMFYLCGGRAYYHLGAYNEAGCKSKASCALFDLVIKSFAREKIRYLILGGGAGINPPEDDGLVRFKKGWVNMEKPVYFCGKIIRKEDYQELSKVQGNENSSYFPAYRSGKWG